MSNLISLLRAAVATSLTNPNTACVVSGGVDSSTITTLARELRPNIPTFTGWYDTPGFDEREYARLVTNPEHHTEVLITPEDFVEHFDRMAQHSKPPYQGMGAFGQYMVAKAVHDRGCTTALSGEGGDELFGGYARLIIVAGGLPPTGYDNYRLPDGYPTNLKDALQYDLDRLPDLLAVDDQMCAAWDIEAIAPFTSQSVMDWALALDPRDRVGKRTLKNAVTGIVPDQILNRTDKMGMPIPLVQWTVEHEGVRQFVFDRIGYLPNPQTPWDRGWWHQLLTVCG